MKQRKMHPKATGRASNNEPDPRVEPLDTDGLFEQGTALAREWRTAVAERVAADADNYGVVMVHESGRPQLPKTGDPVFPVPGHPEWGHVVFPLDPMVRSLAGRRVPAIILVGSRKEVRMLESVRN